MSRFKKVFLPILLLALAIGSEIVGIIVCGKMLPDYKNEVFIEENQNINQLIFVDNKDNSRFYPWLSYHADEMVSAQSYIENHLYDQSLDVFFNNSSENVEKYDLDDYVLKKIIISEINQLVFYIIEDLDRSNYPQENIDFSKDIKFDNNASVIYLKDVKYINQNNETKLLDLVVKLSTYDVLYFRIRNENPEKPTSQEISRKNKELLENVEEIFTYLIEWTPPNYKEIEEKDKYDSEEFEIGESNNLEEKNAKNYSDNIIYNYITSLNMVDFYLEEDKFVFCTMSSDKFILPVRIVVSAQILNSQYTIFSNSDELIIVLSGMDDNSKYSDTILYYSISENKITGFSTKSTF